MTLSKAEINRRYRERNKEQVNARARTRRAERLSSMTEAETTAYKARRRADSQRFRERNPDYWKEWHHEHRDESRVRYNAWRTAHPDRAKAATDKWRNANREKVRESVRRRKASRLGAAGGYDVGRWMGRVDYYGGLCWICRVRPGVQPDHVLALCNGGTNWLSNIRPACGRCNSQKGRWEMTGRKSVAEVLTWAKLKARDYR